MTALVFQEPGKCAFGLVFMMGTELTKFLKAIWIFCTVKYEARLEDGTVVSKSDGVEFTVRDGMLAIFLAIAL